MLLKRMEEAVDGEYQDFKSKDGAYVREHFFGKYPELKAMVADMSDDEIWRLNRGGHDPLKVYAAYARGGEAQGPADRHPRQDRQGLRHGRGRRGPEHHPPAEEDGRDAPARVPRPLPAADLRRRSCQGLPFLQLRRRAVAGDRVPARAPRGARRLPAGAAARRPSRSQVPPLSAFEAQLKGTGRARDLDHDGVRAHPQHAAARQEDRQARGADRARRVAHLRHGGHVPPVRHLLARSASSTGRRTPTS